MNETITFPDWTDDVARLALDFRDDELTRLAKAAKDPRAGEQAGRFRPHVSLPRRGLACVNVATLEKHPAVDEIVRGLLPRYSFRLVRVPCSLKPAEDSHIASATLELNIGQLGQGEPPLVFSIFPEQVIGAGSRTTEAVFEPSLKLKPDEAEASLGRIGRTVQVGQLRPRIDGFYTEDSASWLLTTMDAEGVRGPYTFLVVLQWPRQVVPVPLVVSASATVETRLFGFIRTRKLAYEYTAFHPRVCRD
jgi:hypothetical protein